jgi:hypothetical protein
MTKVGLVLGGIAKIVSTLNISQNMLAKTYRSMGRETAALNVEMTKTVNGTHRLLKLVPFGGNWAGGYAENYNARSGMLQRTEVSRALDGFTRGFDSQAQGWQGRGIGWGLQANANSQYPGWLAYQQRALEIQSGPRAELSGINRGRDALFGDMDTKMKEFTRLRTREPGGQHATDKQIMEAQERYQNAAASLKTYEEKTVSRENELLTLIPEMEKQSKRLYARDYIGSLSTGQGYATSFAQELRGSPDPEVDPSVVGLKTTSELLQEILNTLQGNPGITLRKQ